MDRSITIETKIFDDSNLDLFGSFYCDLEKKLFNKLANAEVIDKDFRNNLKSSFIVKYQIHARLFNMLWSDAKGKLDALKETYKDNQKDLKRKIKKYNKKIKQAEKYLKRGFRKAKKNPLKPHEIKQLRQNLRIFKEVIHKLTHILEKEFEPSIVFGTRVFYKKQWSDEKYVDNHKQWKEEWRTKRNGHFAFIGSKDETNGNGLCQYIADQETIRITLPYCFKGKHLEIPVKFSSNDEKTNQQYYFYLHQAVINKQALSYRFLKRENGFWYVQVSFTLYGDAKKYFNGTIGVDMNYNLVATTEINRHGNYVGFKNYEFDSENMTSEQASNRMSEIIQDIVRRAKELRMSVAIEKLNLEKCKTDNAKFINRKVSLIQYGILRDKIEVKCIKENVWLDKVHPAYTSIIGKYKYKKFYGISVHNSAALVIARRANKYIDKVPNQICRVLHSGDASEFEKIHKTRHHWAHWSFVNKNLENCLMKINSSAIGLSSDERECSVNNHKPRFNPNRYVVPCLVSCADLCKI